MNPSFWKGKRVFVTGHTGFKGSWLALWLQSMQAEVTGYSLPAPTEPNLFTLARLSDSMKSIEGDVRDLDAFQKAAHAAQPEILIHMAAQPLVKYSYANPVETYSTNVMGTVHALEVSRSLDSLRAVVIVTSDKCYDNKESSQGYRETDELGGHDPYSNSKGCAELVTAAYRKSFFNSIESKRPRIASARAGNVIGGGDWALDRLIPDAIRSFSQRQSVFIRHPAAIRPWQHVCEPLSGYLTLAERLYAEGGADYAQPWNFGPLDTDAQPVSWVIDRVSTLWGDGAQWQKDTAPTVAETKSLLLDCTKARTILGWQPRLTLEEALTWTVEWYRACHLGKNMQDMTRQQLSQYQARVSQ